MPPRPPKRSEVADSLLAVGPLIARWIEHSLARHEPPLTPGQYLALRAIDRDGVAGSELARRTGVSGPAVSQLVAGLADAGLVDRRPDDSDRRRQELALTPAGKAALRSADRSLRRAVAVLLEDTPDPEMHALARALPHVEAALEGTPPPRRPPPPPPPPHHRGRPRPH